MLVTPAKARINRLVALLMALGLASVVWFFGALRARTDAQLWAGWVPAGVVVAGVAFVFFTRKYRRRGRVLMRAFPENWRQILSARVPFYAALPLPEQRRFEANVAVFLDEKRITGIRTEVDDATRLLVAASAVIPIFGFGEWEYDNLAEVLIYPRSFDDQMQLEGSSRNILGLVGSAGPLNRLMILSKPDLHRGFGGRPTPHHVGIHEFVHLIDGADGAVDGVPAATCPDCVKPWLEVMRREMARIARGDSVLRRYGLSSPAEFFAVASEAFFTTPARLAQGHPELYRLLQRIFHQDTRARLADALRTSLLPYPRRARHAVPCPCGSNERLEDCCLGR